MKKIIIILSLILSTIVFAEGNWGRVEENIRERVKVEKIVEGDKTLLKEGTKSAKSIKIISQQKIEEYKKADRDKVFEANRITEKWD